MGEEDGDVGEEGGGEGRGKVEVWEKEGGGKVGRGKMQVCRME